MCSGVGGDRGPSPPRECDLVLLGGLDWGGPHPVSASSTPRSVPPASRGQQVRSAQILQIMRVSWPKEKGDILC